MYLKNTATAWRTHELTRLAIQTNMSYGALHVHTLYLAYILTKEKAECKYRSHKSAADEG